MFLSLFGSGVLRTIVTAAINMKPKVVFVLGGPGAGKGTQCSKIVEHFGYTHLSAGDLLRAERNNPESEYGELIENYIKEGKIVPVEITCSLLENAMKESGKEKFLIDGFPRNKNNLDGWNKVVADKIDLQFILFFDCPLDVCLERCIKRGASGSGRTDDNEESMKKRCNVYINETKPIIEHYEKYDLVKRIDASKTESEVFENVKQIFHGTARGDQ